MEHIARLNDFSLYDAANNGVVHFFLTIADETWYQDLKDANTYYLEVTATTMLVYFLSNWSGLHEVDTITIQGEMMDYFGQVEGIPQYINRMDAAQARAKWSNLPISNEALVSIANRVMLGTKEYADETKGRNKRHPD